MGEVYRARDTKLAREVALKVLPQAFAGDAERMARFEREAQVLASLNHPNIAAIYGLEESGATRALVMELVEGPTLEKRIQQAGLGERLYGAPVSTQTREGRKGPPLSVDESLNIAKQIAEALEYAHERGIIHRDLKPANIKITAEGSVKVLDFGLAKALDTSVAAMSPSPTGPRTPMLKDSPTLTAAATQAGVILGTAAYMSPEQARGKTADRRADIWAFGCVLYEMLTGQQAFSGETVSDTLAAVLRAEPDWSALPAASPPRVRELIRRCVIKDPKQRLRDIGEARIAIEESLSGPTDVGATLAIARGRAQGPPLQPWRRAAPWAMAAISMIALLTLIVSNMLRSSRPPTRPVARLAVTLPPGDRLALGPLPHIALAPDGSRLVYAAVHSGTTQLYLRAIDRFETTPIPGTEGAESPFFSHDGQSVGFFAGGTLKEVSLSGGAPLTLCSAPSNRGGSWGFDGSIIFSPSPSSGLFRISAAGGAPKPLTAPDHKQGEISHRWPEILPGGKAAVFTIFTGAGLESARIGVLSLETGERRMLVRAGAYARYFPSGHLVYARAGGLQAVPFDLQRLEVTGTPVPVFEGVSMNPGFFSAEFSSTSDGSLAYVPGVRRLPTVHLPGWTARGSRNRFRWPQAGTCSLGYLPTGGGW
jgi:serine/threonine-protein kinase